MHVHTHTHTCVLQSKVHSLHSTSQYTGAEGERVSFELKGVRGWYGIKNHFCVTERRGQIVIQLWEYEEEEIEDEVEDGDDDGKRLEKNETIIV